MKQFNFFSCVERKGGHPALEGIYYGEGYKVACDRIVPAAEVCAAVVPYVPRTAVPVTPDVEGKETEGKESEDGQEETPKRVKRGPDYWRIRANHPMTLEEIGRSAGQFKVYVRKPSNRIFLGGGIISGVAAAACIRTIEGMDQSAYEGYRVQIREKYLGVVYEYEPRPVVYGLRPEEGHAPRRGRGIFGRVAGMFRRIARIF